MPNLYWLGIIFFFKVVCRLCSANKYKGIKMKYTKITELFTQVCEVLEQSNDSSVEITVNTYVLDNVRYSTITIDSDNPRDILDLLLEVELYGDYDSSRHSKRVTITTQ